MKLKLYDYSARRFEEVDSHSLTDELARRFIPQDENTQGHYTLERRRGRSIAEALARTSQARFDRFGRA